MKRSIVAVWCGTLLPFSFVCDANADSCSPQVTTKLVATDSSLGMAPAGSNQGAIVGPRVDLEPDFDIYDIFGHEVSANCNDCIGKSVDVGQPVRAKLKTQVSNADADGFKRSSSSNTIEGPVWWMIEGKTGWNLLASGEYTISNLDKGKETVETHEWTIPNYPGDILAMKACVDGDDEIYEEGESSGSGSDINSPDQGGTTNNCSRRERFYIKHPNYIPAGAIESGACTQITGWAKDGNTTAPLWVQVYSSNPDGTNQMRLDDFVAGVNRPDKGGNYGIEWTVPLALKDNIARTVTFSAVNVPEGTNSTIGNISLTCSPPAPENHVPTGEVEQGDCAGVWGWARDQDAVSPLTVQAYVSNPDGTNQVRLGDIVANSPRGDLGGNFGIAWTMPNAVKDSRERLITLYAVNVPEGPNPVIGSVTVNCQHPATDEDQAAIRLLNE